jgi:electron transfer flavoprotein beta subunit
MSMNPFDEIAVEEAVRLKEGHGTEIIAVSVGPTAGAGNPAHRAGDGRRPRHPGQGGRGSAAAGRRQDSEGLVAKEGPELVIMGKQAIDDDRPDRPDVGALMGWAQGTFASKVADRGRHGHHHSRDRRRPGDREP